MTDSQLFAALTAAVTSGLTARALPAAVLAAYQPTQQGTGPRPAVYLHRIGSKVYGFRGRKSVPGAGVGLVTHAEMVYWERTFQVNVLIDDAPPVANPDLTLPTPFDYVKAVQSVLQSDAGRAILAASGLGILRITDIRETYVKDDRDRYIPTPNFDFTLSFSEVDTTVVPAIAPPVTSGIFPV